MGQAIGRSRSDATFLGRLTTWRTTPLHGTAVIVAVLGRRGYLLAPSLDRATRVACLRVREVRMHMLEDFGVEGGAGSQAPLSPLPECGCVATPSPPPGEA